MTGQGLQTVTSGSSVFFLPPAIPFRVHVRRKKLRKSSEGAGVGASMKMLPLLMILMACVTTVADGPLTFRLLKAGSNAQGVAIGDATAKAIIAADETTYRRIWQEMIEETPPPPADFAKQTVVFLVLGSRRTGGYAVDVRGVSAAGNAVTIDAPVTTPGSRAIVSDAFTAPFVVVAVDRKQIASVRWLSGDREIATTGPSTKP
ncbi:MAG: protease complex subunit PrcB family protein [Acidobacteriota bacterium]